jgi:transposase-like protein
VARVAASIVAELCRRIVAGELRPGDLVPSGRDIARDLDVTVAAAYHALTRMRQDGLAEKVADGPGFVVTEQAPEIAAGWQAPTWGRGPGRRESVTRVDADFVPLIVRTAIELADADGLREVTSMRRIAGQLDVESATLRKHVHDRGHLQILMADAIFAEHPPPEPGAKDLRGRLEALSRLQLLMYRRHLWLAKAVSFKKPLLSPHVAGHIEWAAAQAGRPAVLTAMNFVRGHAMRRQRDDALFDFGLQRLLDGLGRP